MTTITRNRLHEEKSPYLLQHADNPVDWYPWGAEAFRKAKDENKPVFLSIGYSTCHWCHVMARESFSDEEVASLLNRYFVPIKVDKEERPDVDGVYMRVCQTLTGSGGWPLSIFLTPEQKPFLAGTYFPKDTVMNRMGFLDILRYIAEQWENDRERLLENADLITEHIGKQEDTAAVNGGENLIEKAVADFAENFDGVYGGFGIAPKFPTPHNLLFLMERYEAVGGEYLLEMVETTLTQMYRGGIFDHIGGGFCRYATDRYFLVPHFEKMLYDNALLILCYAEAYEITQKERYREIAKRTADFVLNEMTGKNHGFYAAQDADSEGEEGKYYLFTPEEIIAVLGEEEGMGFNRRFDISQKGNFEGKNIPNLLRTEDLSAAPAKTLQALGEYRKERTRLFTDDKILTAWNGMMIAALAVLYRISGEKTYRHAAEEALSCLKRYAVKEKTLLVGMREEHTFGEGFLDDYAYLIFALLQLYEGTLDETHLLDAINFCDIAVDHYLDKNDGGFFLSGRENEALITPVKDVYDAAIPCGNAVMSFNLLLLADLTRDEHYQQLAEEQLHFMKANVGKQPRAAGFFLYALNRNLYPPQEIVCVGEQAGALENVPLKTDLRATLLMKKPDEYYPLLNDEATYYVCQNRTCLPPTNDLRKLYRHPHKS
ncbi:MAG TPA: thioredoxin domain-containing protein [Clostridiales bacterium]|nr:thioredoxin domain-containing protein [Clostridiales bacterium]